MNKLTPADLYSFSIFVRNTIPTNPKYYKDTLPNVEVEWKNIYLLPHRVTIDTKLRMFQYKILNNILYLNKHLLLFGKKDNKFCSYCLTEEETISHIFATCHKTSSLWNKLKFCLKNSVHIPEFNPQSAIFGFLQVDPHFVLILNHIVLLFKYYVYFRKDSNKLSLAALIKI